MRIFAGITVTSSSTTATAADSSGRSVWRRATTMSAQTASTGMATWLLPRSTILWAGASRP